MKVRNGFVSNSSASSFICAFGEIKEDVLKKVKNLISSYNHSEEEIIRTGKDLQHELDNSKWSKFGECDYAGVYIDIGELKEDSYYFCFEDSQDCGTNDDGEILDTDYDDFSCCSFIDEIQKFIPDIEIQYGSGRNG